MDFTTNNAPSFANRHAKQGHRNNANGSRLVTFLVSKKLRALTLLSVFRAHFEEIIHTMKLTFRQYSDSRPTTKGNSSHGSVVAEREPEAQDKSVDMLSLNLFESTTEQGDAFLDEQGKEGCLNLTPRKEPGRIDSPCINPLGTTTRIIVLANCNFPFDVTQRDTAVEKLAALLKPLSISKLTMNQVTNLSWSDIAKLFAACTHCNEIQIESTSLVDFLIPPPRRQGELVAECPWATSCQHLTGLALKDVNGSSIPIMKELAQVVASAKRLHSFHLTTYNMDSLGFSTLIRDGVMARSSALSSFSIVEERFGTLDYAMALPNFCELLGSGCQAVRLEGFWSLFENNGNNSNNYYLHRSGINSKAFDVSEKIFQKINTLERLTIENIESINPAVSLQLFKLFVDSTVFPCLTHLVWSGCESPLPAANEGVEISLRNELAALMDILQANTILLDLDLSVRTRSGKRLHLSTSDKAKEGRLGHCGLDAFGRWTIRNRNLASVKQYLHHTEQQRGAVLGEWPYLLARVGQRVSCDDDIDQTALYHFMQSAVAVQVLATTIERL